jgi:heme A synthase
MLKGMKQIRRGAGVILIGLGLLMAIGVSRAKLPSNPVVIALTIGISVVLPIAVGIGLIASTRQRTQKSESDQNFV